MPPGLGALVFEGGYHPHKPKHVIRVVFQDQVMYARRSLKQRKSPKLEKKGVCLGHAVQ